MSKKAEEIALKTRDFVTANRFGVLSTVSKSQGGYPFGSLTPYDIDPEGRLYIYISLIAEHFQNLSIDSRASLCITDPFAYSDPQASARATVLGRFVRIEEIKLRAVQESYEHRFPGAVNFEIAHNFLFMELKPERVRWIGGFGEIAWVEGERFCASKPDGLSYVSFSIIEHMNHDHADALLVLTRAFCKEAGEIKKVTMTAIHSHGFRIAYEKQGKRFEETIDFHKPINSAEEARVSIIALLKEARGILN